MVGGREKGGVSEGSEYPIGVCRTWGLKLGELKERAGRERGTGCHTEQ